MRKPVIHKELNTVKDISLTEDAFFEEVHVSEVEQQELEVQGLTFEHSILEKVNISSSALSGLKLLDVRIFSCNIANSECEEIYCVRTEYENSRLTGLQAINGKFQDVYFKNCKIDLSSFRFSTFKDVRFENCILKGADFIGATFENVVFRDCDLEQVEFSQTTLKELDIRGSKIEGIRISIDALKNMKVDTGQALYLVQLIGLKVED